MQSSGGIVMPETKQLQLTLKKLKAFWQSDKKIKLIVAIGFLGILLIFFSSFFTKNDQLKTSDVNSVSIDEYTDKLENKILLLVTSMRGVGKANVMVTVERELAVETNSTLQRTNAASLLEAKVQGVVVVCEGADDIVVEQQVVDAVATALNIPTSKVCVTKMID